MLGGILVKISGVDSNCKKRHTKQIAYVTNGVERIFLSRGACEDLGIVGKSFPQIGEFTAQGEQECFIQSVKGTN